MCFLKQRIKITINKIYYFYPKIDYKHSIVIETPNYQSCYQVLAGVYNNGNKGFILKDIILKIENLTLRCVNHKVLELKPDEYKQFLWIFPSPPSLSREKGKYILTLIDDKNRLFSVSGRFPKFDISY
ncbi:MAG: hypothetical protein N2323_06040 [candidate division WOR-3 bacterium]|nr:hypothetical protein [candidate division WOR-3 bacterium]MCX7837494.1 hypothetical protein [candidate division WOR-3 bacterium]MDW8113399.1 hypothetical protein [candidate division WOR-3 bacterium]